MKTYPLMRPAETELALVRRVCNLLGDLRSNRAKGSKKCDGQQFGLPFNENEEKEIDTPLSSVVEFLNYAAAISHEGGPYIFGGVLRDIAMFGREGFTSDIDIVIDGGWRELEGYLIRKGAAKNKFGGLRILVDDRPVDVWKAERTWAFSEGLMEYKGIHSLLDTTILNWDSILMDWRNKRLICKSDYFAALHERRLDVVFMHNPNRLGMFIRVLRHLHQKDARKISRRACEYLAQEAEVFAFEMVHSAEIRSYRSAYIDRRLYDFFLRREFGSEDESVASVSDFMNPALFSH